MIPTVKSFETEQPADDLPLDRPRQSGFVLKPIDKEAALAMLDSFLTDSNPEKKTARRWNFWNRQSTSIAQPLAQS